MTSHTLNWDPGLKELSISQSFVSRKISILRHFMALQIVLAYVYDWWMKILAKLADVGVKRLQQFNTIGDARLIALHKTFLNGLIRKFGLSTYQLLWLSFFKGIVIAFVIMYLYLVFRWLKLRQRKSRGSAAIATALAKIYSPTIVRFGCNVKV